MSKAQALSLETLLRGERAAALWRSGQYLILSLFAGITLFSPGWPVRGLGGCLLLYFLYLALRQYRSARHSCLEQAVQKALGQESETSPRAGLSVLGSVAAPWRVEVSVGLSFTLWLSILLYVGGMSRSGQWYLVAGLGLAVVVLGVAAGLNSPTVLLQAQLSPDNSLSLLYLHNVSRQVCLRLERVSWLYREDKLDGVRQLAVLRTTDLARLEVELPASPSGQEFFSLVQSQCLHAALGYRAGWNEAFEEKSSDWPKIVESSRSSQLN